MKSYFLMVARQDLEAIELEIVILKIVLAISLMVLLGLIGSTVFMYRRNRTRKQNEAQ